MGGTGQLGQSLRNQILKSDIKFIAPSSSDLDIRDFQKTRNYIVDYNPSNIINCSGWTNVAKAESNTLEANILNGYAVNNLIQISRDISSTLVHISTDYVFSGSKTLPYLVNDKVDPINAYGVSKVIGEQLIQESNAEKFYIFRTAWLYSEFGANFVKTIISKYNAGQNQIKVVNDQFGNPTFATDLASQIIQSIRLNIPYGIYHAVNNGTASWYDLAVQTLNYLGNSSNVIHGISSNEYMSEVPRPQYTSLDTSKWSDLDIPGMRSWEEALSLAVPKIIQNM